MSEQLYKKVPHGKTFRYVPVNSPVMVTDKNDGPLSEDAKTIHISLAVGMLEIVRYDENKFKPMGARTRAINNLIDNSLKVCDFYRINSWPAHKLNKATNVLDDVESLVRQYFSEVEFDKEGAMK